MDNAELGRRLKSARLAKKMTQSDVVGTFITRNMLSQIESGTATPSMKTLEYLSSVLELPLDKLLSEAAGGIGSGNRAEELLEAKQMLRERRFDALLAIEVHEGDFSDELHALRSIAHLELARALAESESAEALQRAVAHAKSAAEEAAVGLYANQARVSEANLLIARIAQFLSDYYSSLAAGGVR